MNQAIFVSGTDTGVGKTVVTGCLAAYLCAKGYRAITQKWIETGCSGPLSDIETHLAIMRQNKEQIREYLSLLSPYAFKTPSSPHLASKIEGKRIHPDKIIGSFKMLSSRFDFVIIEGVGGLLVPFNKKDLVIDIVKKLNLPVLVVARNRLGAINQTLLTLESLRQRKLKCLGIVFTNPKKEDKRIIKDNPLIIKALTKERVFGVLPWQDSQRKLYKDFIPIAQRILERIKHG